MSPFKRPWKKPILNRVNAIVAELFIRGRQSYFGVPKNIGLNLTHYFVMKIPNKRELQEIAFNHSPDNGFQDFMNFLKNVLQNYIRF